MRLVGSTAGRPEDGIAHRWSLRDEGLSLGSARSQFTPRSGACALAAVATEVRAAPVPWAPAPCGRRGTKRDVYLARHPLLRVRKSHLRGWSLGGVPLEVQWRLPRQAFLLSGASRGLPKIGLCSWLTLRLVALLDESGWLTAGQRPRGSPHKEMQEAHVSRTGWAGVRPQLTSGRGSRKVKTASRLSCQTMFRAGTCRHG